MSPAVRKERQPRVMVVGPGRRSAGGIAVVIETLAGSSLAERYGLVTVVTHRDGSRVGKLTQALAGFARAAALLATRRVDLVYLHTSSGFSLRRKAVVAALSRLAGRKYVLHVHGSDFDRYYDDAAGWERWLVRRTLSSADVVIALSPIWERRLRAIAACDPIAIPNPVPIPAEPAHGGSEPPRILFLGRLGDRKGSRTLVRALSMLDRRQSDVRLTLAGDGDLAFTREEAQRLGVSDRVELPGWIDATERRRALSSATVFALPSREEGIPVALLEAMAYGLPAVVSPVGGIPDVFHDGRHGYFVPPDDPEALADRLGALLDEPEAARRMGSQARRDAQEQYATEVVAAQVGDALEAALARRVRAGPA